jgi:hypothetical protein
MDITIKHNPALLLPSSRCAHETIKVEPGAMVSTATASMATTAEGDCSAVSNEWSRAKFFRTYTALPVAARSRWRRRCLATRVLAIGDRNSCSERRLHVERSGVTIDASWGGLLAARA